MLIEYFQVLFESTLACRPRPTQFFGMLRIIDTQMYTENKYVNN